MLMLVGGRCLGWMKQRQWNLQARTRETPSIRAPHQVSVLHLDVSLLAGWLLTHGLCVRSRRRSSLQVRRCRGVCVSTDVLLSSGRVGAPAGPAVP